MKKTAAVFACFSLIWLARPAYAWWDSGHMLVAYIAYQKLTPETKGRVDALLRLNPQYSRWVEGVPTEKRELVAFMYSATWPDCIKNAQTCPGYVSDGPDGGNTPPQTPQASQNAGYSDHAQHKYWHFVDEPLSEGVPGDPPKFPNAEYEIVLLTKAINSSEPDAVKSYDLAWIEHLVGDVHQPLHAVSRFTKGHPDGDQGGNLIKLCEPPCRDNLHGYWDGLFGQDAKPSRIEKIGERLLQEPTPEGGDESEVHTWVESGILLAKTKVYISPITPDNDPSVTVSPRPNEAYHAEALKTAQTQVLLAGARLAALLNVNLK